MRRQFQRHGRDEGGGGVDAEQRGRQADTTNAITLTLTVIVIMYAVREHDGRDYDDARRHRDGVGRVVIMYAVLVSPAEISNIFTQMINSYLEQQRSTHNDDINDPAVQSGEDEDTENASVHPD